MIIKFVKLNTSDVYKQYSLTMNNNKGEMSASLKIMFAMKIL